MFRGEKGQGSYADSGMLTHASSVREVSVFLCYRRIDGSRHADWLYQHLENARFRDVNGNNCRIRVYYDRTAPGVADWKKLHFPSLQTSQAMILVCTPGIATNVSRRGQPDWVYTEVRWWRGHRNTAPIVVDATGEGNRWLPNLLTRKWPNINWIDLHKTDAAAAEGTDMDFATRICARIIDAIREGEQPTRFETLERFELLNKRYVAALLWAVGLFILAAALSLVAINARHPPRTSRTEYRSTEKQKRDVINPTATLLENTLLA